MICREAQPRALVAAKTQPLKLTSDLEPSYSHPRPPLQLDYRIIDPTPFLIRLPLEYPTTLLRQVKKTRTFAYIGPDWGIFPSFATPVPI